MSSFIIIIICLISGISLTLYFFPIYKLSLNKLALYIGIVIFVGIVTFLVTGDINKFISHLFDTQDLSKESIDNYLYFFLAAFNEEVTKVIIPILLYSFTNVIERPFDFIFFCVGGAIGFSLVESYDYAINHNNYIQISRFITHIACSIVFGYFFSLYIYYHKLSKKYYKTRMKEKLKATEIEIKSYRYFIISIFISSFVHCLHNIIVIYHFSFINYFVFLLVLFLFTIKKLSYTRFLAPYESIKTLQSDKFILKEMMKPSNDRIRPYFVNYSTRDERDGKIRYYISENNVENIFEIFVWVFNNSVIRFDLHYDVHKNEKMICWNNGVINHYEVFPEKENLVGMKKTQISYSIPQYFNSNYWVLYKNIFKQTIDNSSDDNLIIILQFINNTLNNKL